jgi:hypothetical protein
MNVENAICEIATVVESRTNLNHWYNSISEFRESRHGEAKETLQHELRNRDMRSHDVFAAVRSRNELDR